MATINAAALSRRVESGLNIQNADSTNKSTYREDCSAFCLTLKVLVLTVPLSLGIDTFSLVLDFEALKFI